MFYVNTIYPRERSDIASDLLDPPPRNLDAMDLSDPPPRNLDAIDFTDPESLNPLRTPFFLCPGFLLALLRRL